MSAPLSRKHPHLNKLPYTDKSLFSNKRPYSNELRYTDKSLFSR